MVATFAFNILFVGMLSVISQCALSFSHDFYFYRRSIQLEVKPATLLIPMILFFFFWCYGTRYQSGSFFFINVGSGFSLPACFSFLCSLPFL